MYHKNVGFHDSTKLLFVNFEGLRSSVFVKLIQYFYLFLIIYFTLLRLEWYEHFPFNFSVPQWWNAGTLIVKIFQFSFNNGHESTHGVYW